VLAVVFVSVFPSLDTALIIVVVILCLLTITLCLTFQDAAPNSSRSSNEPRDFGSARSRLCFAWLRRALLFRWNG
jgi:hypothetical protein